MQYHSADPKDCLVFSSKALGDDHEIAPGLSVREAKSKCGQDIFLVHPVLLILWTHVRITIGVALTVGSLYRTWLHHLAEYDLINKNRKKLGLEPTKVPQDSAHLYGMAIDIHCKGDVKEKIIALAKKLGVGGIGVYSWGVHLDIAAPDRRW